MFSNMLDDTLILKGLNPTVYYYKHPSGRPLNVQDKNDRRLALFRRNETRFMRRYVVHT